MAFLTIESNDIASAKADWYIIQGDTKNLDNMNCITVPFADDAKEESIRTCYSNCFSAINEIRQVVQMKSVAFSVLTDSKTDQRNTDLIEIAKRVLEEKAEECDFNIVLVIPKPGAVLDNSSLFSSLVEDYKKTVEQLIYSLDSVFPNRFNSNPLEHFANKRVLEDIKKTEAYGLNDVFKFKNNLKTLLGNIDSYVNKYNDPRTPVLKQDLLDELQIHRSRLSKWNPMKDIPDAPDAINLAKLLVAYHPTPEEFDRIVDNWVRYQFVEILIAKQLIISKENQGQVFYHEWDDELIDEYLSLLESFGIQTKEKTVEESEMA